MNIISFTEENEKVRMRSACDSVVSPMFLNLSQCGECVQSTSPLVTLAIIRREEKRGVRVSASLERRPSTYASHSAASAVQKESKADIYCTIKVKSSHSPTWFENSICRTDRF